MIAFSAEPLDRSRKAQTMAMTPVSYMAGRYRSKDAVDRVYGVAIDVDDGHLFSFDQMVARLTELDLAFIVHSTTKSTLACNRYRVILPLTRDIPGAAYPALFSSIIQAFGGLADTNCKDASRLSILPHHWTGGDIEEAEAHRAIVTRDGRDLDPVRLMARFPPILEPDPEPIVAPIISASVHHPDIADLDRSPAVSERIRSEYLTATQGGRLYRFMSQVAARAISRGFAIDADILAALAQQMNNCGPSAHRRENLKREAGRALSGALSHIAANPRPERTRKPSAMEAARILKTRKQR